MTSDTKKSINVVAAFVLQNGCVFAAQRDYGELKGKWEFPGGKIESGETPQQALKREIMEELQTEIEVGEFFCHVEYDYPYFYLKMDVFHCIVKTGRLLIEKGVHSAEAFIPVTGLGLLDWCPADRIIVDKILTANIGL